MHRLHACFESFFFCSPSTFWDDINVNLGHTSQQKMARLRCWTPIFESSMFSQDTGIIKVHKIPTVRERITVTMARKYDFSLGCRLWKFKFPHQAVMQNDANTKKNLRWQTGKPATNGPRSVRCRIYKVVIDDVAQPRIRKSKAGKGRAEPKA